LDRYLYVIISNTSYLFQFALNPKYSLTAMYLKLSRQKVSRVAFWLA
jgi:hypothetical protein